MFGPLTEQATREFQLREQLVLDGVVGEATLSRGGALGARSFRRVRDSEVTPEMTKIAKQVLKDHFGEPLGSEFPFEFGENSYFARLEEHYHPEGGPIRPWGYHTGVSLFVVVEPGSSEPVHESNDVA